MRETYPSRRNNLIMENTVKTGKEMVMDGTENRMETSTKPKIKIEVNCKQYSMIFPNTVTRPKKKPTRGRCSKSKTPSLGLELTPSKENQERPEAFSNKGSPVIRKTERPPSEPRLSKRLTRQKSEALGSLNAANNVNNEEKMKKVVIRRPKRKRLPEENDIAAENIPVEAVLPALQFGLNKEMCPKKRRLLQSLIFPKKFP